jgi:RNA-dependent RNA polymerase
VAADSWLALMDRLLILREYWIEEKDHVKANILQLIDIYYDALDAPKKGGQKVSSVSFLFIC